MGTLFSGTLAAFAVAHAPTATELGTWHDALAALTDPWTDFSSSVGWTASPTPPAIGNGTIQASYIRDGKFFVYKGRISMGSTTTFGSGSWQINLPVTSTGLTVGGALTFDTSTSANKQPAAPLGSASGTCNFAGIGGPLSATLPYAWASGDRLDWIIIGETT